MQTRRFFRLLTVCGLSPFVWASWGCSSSEAGASGAPAADDGGVDAGPPAACHDGFPIRIVSGKIIVTASIVDGVPKSWALDTGAITSLVIVRSRRKPARDP